MKYQPNLIGLEKWDIILILDACRHDYFEEQNVIPGKLQPVRTIAQQTPTWLMKTFPGHYDYIYCSGNPLIGEYVLTPWGSKWKGVEHFSKIDPVWDWGWDKRQRTVLPSTILRSVTDHLNEGKKIVGHLMQPHGPFIGKTKIPMCSMKKTRHEALGKPDPVDQDIPMFAHPMLKTGYRDNLIFVLKEILPFCEEYAEKYNIVITSDHGELLGEYGRLGHVFPEAFYYDFEELYKVPWLEVSKQTKVLSRIKALGY